MSNRLINFETAKLANKAGFNWHTPRFYATDSFLNEFQCKAATFEKGETGPYSILDESEHPIIKAPIQSHLKTWLRHEHDIYVEVEIPWFSKEGEIVIEEESGFGWWIAGDGIYEETFPEDNLKSYEKALEKGLQKALEIVLNK